MTDNWLICGTKTKIIAGYKELVFKTLTTRYYNETGLQPQGSNWKPTIIEGCCPDSADVYAEEWAKERKIEVKHHPATEGSYLKRNIEMVRKADLVIAFWDGFSYGTAHTIAWATRMRVPIIIIMIREVREYDR